MYYKNDYTTGLLATLFNVKASQQDIKPERISVITSVASAPGPCCTFRNPAASSLYHPVFLFTR
jgi:hypothetical protein